MCMVSNEWIGSLSCKIMTTICTLKILSFTGPLWPRLGYCTINVTTEWYNVTAFVISHSALSVHTQYVQGCFIECYALLTKLHIAILPPLAWILKETLPINNITRSGLALLTRTPFIWKGSSARSQMHWHVVTLQSCLPSGQHGMAATTTLYWYWVLHLAEELGCTCAIPCH